MDWLRRNWPDLLIGVALVAVIAGIIATLISGGSFFPVGQGDRAGSTPPPISTPSTTPSTTPLTPDGAQPSGVITGGAPQPDATQPPAVGTPQGADGPGVAVLPPAGTPDAPAAVDQPSTPAPGAGAPVTALPPAGTDGPSQAPAAVVDTPAPPSPTPTPAVTPPPAPAAASGTSEQASYRVSVGAFGNADNAQRLAQQFQGAGYPVLLGTQGNLTIVLVGPYATEAEARRVADQVRAGNFGVADPTVYLYDPQADGSSAAASGTPGPAPVAPAAPAAAVTDSPAAAPGSGRYLQVGAYANRESSLPQRQLLESKGFTVAEVQEGSYIKLLVGPYQGDALSEAQRRLAADGIENFARSL